MKKLILITNELSGGGAERVMSVIANDFVERGIEVLFLVLKKTKAEYCLNPKIKIVYKNRQTSKDVLGQIFFFRKIMKENPGATILSFFTHQNLYAILASIGLNNAIVVSERNDPNYSIHGNFKKKLREFLYTSSLCDKVIFQTSGAAEYFSKKIQLKSAVIPNPLKEQLPKKYEGTRKNTIVSFGRLESQKNYEMLIRAFSLFLKKHSDYTLQLYGKGSQENELKYLADMLGVSEKVVFAGFNKDVHKEIIDAGMFVLPSNYEGLSNSMLEAMAIGLPVICTDSPPGGARMFVKNKKNGILIPVGDTDALTEALNYTAENKQLANQMGNEAYKIRFLLDSKRICDEWEKELFPMEKDRFAKQL